MGKENENEYYSMNQSLFTQDVNGQFINDIKKDFHAVVINNREEDLIRRMIQKVKIYQMKKNQMIIFLIV